MYLQKMFHFKNSNEYEYVWQGIYGKAEERKEKVNLTPEQILRQNRRNKSTKIRRTIKANFGEGDLYVTLTYAAGTRKDIEGVKKDYSAFIKKLRREYRKQGTELKWMRVIEIGSKGGIHVHMIVNRTPCSDELIRKLWTHGHPDYKHLYEDGDFRQLADYMAKFNFDKDGNLKSADKSEYNYSTSRNLFRPEPSRVKKLSSMAMRQRFINGLKAKPGYYVDKGSVCMGINPVTGYSYLKYTEIRIKDKITPDSEEWDNIRERWLEAYEKERRNV